MLTVNELIEQYSPYTDAELYQVLSGQEGYSAEARQALGIVIERKGGKEALLVRLRQQKALATERERIIKEIDELGKKGVDRAFMGTVIQSDKLTRRELDELMDSAYHTTQLEIEDRKIKPRTIIGGIIGIILATLIGGIVTGVLVSWISKGLPVFVVVLLFIGLALGCAFVVKLCTGQSLKNRLVLIATGLSIILAVGVSQPLLDLVLRLILYWK